MSNLKRLFSIQRIKKGRRLNLENNFYLHRNKLTIISGVSGTGKSTLVNILGLIDTCDDVEIIFSPSDGAQYDYKSLYRNKTSLETVRRNYFGFVFQNDHLIDSFSILENLIFPILSRNNGNLSNYSTKGLKEKITNLMEEIGFDDLLKKGMGFFDRSPATLSGGQRQRLSLIRGILHDPEVLIADEPIASVDEKAASNIIHVLKMLIRQGKTVILVAHNKDHHLFNECDGEFIEIVNSNQIKFKPCRTNKKGVDEVS